ncbi:Panacea domain-containing protein [Mycolicibacterium sp. 050158]|uniref:Panacea domain-containing protein n=1 Tax=Mycolicibacterium sp. 050158 TaxID=3090602 RepID=UPI00299D288D|nr:type II toxin-antitoxin system antitoxin SocA domain-containing protein [Mycolicibacterium sp. 050158]MDX1890114.1 DUF4065 domain-containing protein [Mycolicibacterium sp. 050158]
MADVRDVARYILHKRAPMSAMKLQKLVYYSQGWHLAFDGEPLYDSAIEAWANGPVVRDLYRMHRGLFHLGEATLGTYDPASLKPSEVETIDAVLQAYGDLDANQLSNLTHTEAPWIEARSGAPAGRRSDAEIGLASMQEFFDALLSVPPPN